MNSIKRRSVTMILIAVVVMLPAIGAAQKTTARFPVIVVFNDKVNLDGYARRYQADDRALAQPEAWEYLDKSVAGAVQAVEGVHGFRADQVYSAAVRGFAARLTAEQIKNLENDPLISYVEPDGVMYVSQQVLPYGIDRVDADISSTLAGNGSGSVSSVNVYIIDTGVGTHSDINKVNHLNFTGDGNNNDCHGHGTHVAGTVAARDNSTDVVGIVPGAPVTGVKVLGCDGSGATSNIIKGIDWVTANGHKPAVANMSLGGGISTTLDDAVRRSASSGVFYALAAGNSGTDACNTSPARAGAGTNNGIATAAATDRNNAEASFSNFGSCVDIWTPGVDVLSTRLGGGTTRLSGTSMASPHVAGCAALILSRNPTATPASVESTLKSQSLSFGTVSKDGRAIRIANVRNF